MINLSGNSYGRLTVLYKSTNRTKWYESIWWCECECGVIKEIIGRSLTRGKTKSCGCLLKEIAKESKTTHNLSNTESYKSWEAMIHRCYNKNSTNYYNYGEKGVTVCDEWLEFFNFYNDMGERPENKTLDRIDNSLGYCKENCKWSTYVEQSSNKTKSKHNKSGKTGVLFLTERNCWKAYLRFNNKLYTKSGFKTFEDAVLYRKSLERHYHGKETSH